VGSASSSIQPRRRSGREEVGAGRAINPSGWTDIRDARPWGQDRRSKVGTAIPAAYDTARTLPFPPAASRSASFRSVRSQVNSFSVRPKWPYAAVFS
jgi:hypothetical protein